MPENNLTTKLKTLYKALDTLPKLIEDASIPSQKMDEYYVKLQILFDKKEGLMFTDRFDYLFKVKQKLLMSNWEFYYGKDCFTNAQGCFIYYCLQEDESVAKIEGLSFKTEEIFDGLKSVRTLLLLDGFDEVAHLTT